MVDSSRAEENLRGGVQGEKREQVVNAGPGMAGCRGVMILLEMACLPRHCFGSGGAYFLVPSCPALSLTRGWRQSERS